ncbi:D-alanyl-D-alanine carboxypeptidase [Erythrobacter sp. SDW2]|uniref:D-alanyl-D-alanine carboxypeptidase family protein n=1 Tax=Erythrobacter sp. SDW2 TaxID=2907154 RepID=UPI001F22663E|nr:D-alanyl-D-alanine carboxypeptidase family protein [Erythrobacter sp. SDW2]UIP05764.1 D-alanyl-D-alanine carboxypeptidase [Erythrobacter sp. SDW2]
MKRFLGTVLAVAALGVPGHAAPAPVPDDIPIAMLVDLSSGQVLHARNIDRRFVPASITKAMTVYSAFDLIAQGKLRPEQTFTFSEAAAKEWRRTGSTMFLEPGQEVTVNDLLMGITTVSANDGSVVLGEGVAGSLDGWVRIMNANARALGMTQSHFGNPNGFPDGGRTFTTARDLVTLGRALTTEHAALYRRYFGHRGLRTNGFAQDNHDPLTGRVEGADGIKTGFTNQAGFGFLGSAQRGDRRLVLVVAGAAEESQRDETARALMEWGFDNFQSTQLFARGAEFGSARVQDGSASEVTLTTDHPIRFSVPVGATRKLSLAIAYDGPLRAPVRAGETVAELVISVDGMEPSRVPLVAAENVAKAGFFRRIRNALVRLVS